MKTCFQFIILRMHFNMFWCSTTWCNWNKRANLKIKHTLMWSKRNLMNALCMRNYRKGSFKTWFFRYFLSLLQNIVPWPSIATCTRTVALICRPFLYCIDIPYTRAQYNPKWFNRMSLRRATARIGSRQKPFEYFSTCERNKQENKMKFLWHFTGSVTVKGI